MNSEESALFAVHGEPVYVSAVPTTAFSHGNTAVLLAVSVLGLKQIDMFGGTASVPHFEYKSSYLCKLSDCEDVFFWLKPTK